MGVLNMRHIQTQPYSLSLCFLCSTMQRLNKSELSSLEDPTLEYQKEQPQRLQLKQVWQMGAGPLGTTGAFSASPENVVLEP